MKALIIIGMCIVAVLLILLMRKLTPEDKIYPFWAVFVVIVFSLVIISA